MVVAALAAFGISWLDRLCVNGIYFFDIFESSTWSREFPPDGMLASLPGELIVTNASELIALPRESPALKSFNV
jgi:hypothetical protein